MHLEQLKALRRMTAYDKLRVAGEMWKTAWQAKAAYLRKKHPEWTEEEVLREVRRIFAHADA